MNINSTPQLGPRTAPLTPFSPTNPYLSSQLTAPSPTQLPPPLPSSPIDHPSSYTSTVKNTPCSLGGSSFRVSQFSDNTTEQASSPRPTALPSVTPGLYSVPVPLVKADSSFQEGFNAAHQRYLCAIDRIEAKYKAIVMKEQASRKEDQEGFVVGFVEFLDIMCGKLSFGAESEEEEEAESVEL